MANSEALAMRAQRTQSLGQLAVGFVVGKVAVGVLQSVVPSAATSMTDELVLLGGGGYSAWKAVKGGKNANLYAGAALAAASPLLDSLADRIKGMLPGGGA